MRSKKICKCNAYRNYKEKAQRTKTEELKEEWQSQNEGKELKQGKKTQRRKGRDMKSAVLSVFKKTCYFTAGRCRLRSPSRWDYALYVRGHRCHLGQLIVAWWSQLPTGKGKGIARIPVEHQYWARRNPCSRHPYGRSSGSWSRDHKRRLQSAGGLHSDVG